jgi:hypothetical protein
MNTCFLVISDPGCNMFSEFYPKREDMFLTTYALNQFTGVDCVNWEWSCWLAALPFPISLFYAIVLRKLQLGLDIKSDFIGFDCYITKK